MTQQLDLNFDDIKDETLDDLQGDSTQVLTEGLLNHTGAALTTNDFLTAGKYKIAGADNFWEVWVERDETGKVRTHTFVMNWALDMLKKEVNEQKELSKKGEEALIYFIPPWEMAVLLFNEEITPDMTDKQVEKHIWENHRHLWIDESRAPKH